MWAPRYLTEEEADKIIQDSYREVGISLDRNPLNPETMKEDTRLIKAWQEKNPGKLWGLALAKQMDRERGKQLATEKAAKDKA